MIQFEGKMMRKFPTTPLEDNRRVFRQGMIGYHLTKLRAETGRSLLAGQTPTPDFWPSVDWLTYQLTKGFLPLIRIMGKFSKS
jgi:hypothetical protein